MQTLLCFLLQCRANQNCQAEYPENLLAGDIDAMAARSKYFATRISSLLPHQSAFPVCVVAATEIPKCLTVFRTQLVRALHAA